MTFRSTLTLGLTVLAFFAMASSSFAQVNISLIPDPSPGEVQTNNHAQTASPGVSGAGILISGQLVANSPLTATTLRIAFPSPITSSPSTFGPAASIPTADPIRIEGATGVFATVSNPVLNTENSRIEIPLPAASLASPNTQSGTFRLVGVRIDANGKTGAQTVSATLSSGANNYFIATPSATVINAIGPGISNTAIGARSGNTSLGTATIFTNRRVPDPFGSMIIAEGFAGAWRTSQQSCNCTISAGVQNGTQIRLTFNSVPAGVTLALAANLPATGINWTVSNANITATANTTVISFLATSLTAVETIELDYTVIPNPQLSATAAVTTPGTITVTATLAPIGDAVNNTNPAQAGLPRQDQGYPTFIQADVGPLTVVNIAAASTTMLIPLAEKVGVFDTGISIANTTSDLFTLAGGGAVASPGSLKFDFFNTTATGAATPCTLQTSATVRPGFGIAADGTIPAGATYVALLSQLLPASNCAPGDFVGYIFITANFLNAHGQATISDFKTYSLAANVLVLAPPAVAPRAAPTVETLVF
jgi:hypothetical protein